MASGMITITSEHLTGNGKCLSIFANFLLKAESSSNHTEGE